MKTLSKFSNVLFATALAVCAGFTWADDQWEGVERIVAVGDIHGDYEHFVDVLHSAGLINRRGNWVAGETHFVQVGDLPDRGPDTDKIIEHMRRLERQAEDDGGMVHALIGNHEAMNIIGDLRYVHPGEYEAFRTRRSRALRDRFYERHIEQLQAANPEFVADDSYKERFEQQFPLGFVEHRLAWGQEGEIGSWVLEHNAVIKVNRNLFLHGGISPEVLGMTITEINERIRGELTAPPAAEPGLMEAESGPLWYRGLAINDEAIEQAHVDAVLAFYDVDRIILGHTPGLGTVRPRFGGKVLIIDTGISSYYGAHLGSLLLEEGTAYTVQRGEQFEIPEGEAPLLPYYKAIAELEPEASALHTLIRTLEFPTPLTESVSNPVPN